MQLRLVFGRKQFVCIRVPVHITDNMPALDKR